MIKNITFLIFIAGLFSFSSCRKKSPQLACFGLYRVDSTYSNIPSLISKKDTAGPFEFCGWTGEMANQYDISHTFNDTTINYEDTLAVVIQVGYHKLF